MSLARKVAWNTVIHVVGKLLGNIIGVVVVALLTRYLGQEGFGNYATILAYIFFFSAFADLGLYMITINELNKTGIDRRRFFSAVYSLRFFTGMALMFMAGVSVWLMPYPLIVKQGVVIASFTVFFGLLDQIQIAFYQANLSMKRPAITDVTGKSILLIGILIAIKMNVDLLWLLVVWVLSVGIHFAINFAGIRKALRVRIGVDKEFWHSITRKTWPIALSQIFVLIYFKMDVVFLSLLRPADVAQLEVGLYSAPYKFLEVLIAFIPLFMGLMSPILSKAWSEKRLEDFKILYQKVFDSFSIITWPLVVGGVVLAKPLMQLIAPGFEESVVILQILMVAIGIIFFAHLPTYTVNTIGQQRKMLPFYGIVALIAIVLYVGLIPKYSFYAAAGVTVFVEFLVLVFSWIRVNNVTGQKVTWKIFTKSAFSSALMGLVIWRLEDLNVFFVLITGALIYFAVMFVIKGLTVYTVKELFVK